ncbi:hypothetical protein [Pseudomonas syringae]|uniref:hypothetical protein n=1 Tax=Pseudomonas syringae TaxID=317 RepID=UPI0004635282|nr:hypothetical protein [Pseudomonas syringae]
MSNQFKVGDLALTLPDLPEIPSGSVVELVIRIPAGHIFRHASLLAKESGWVVTVSSQISAYYAERHLMPLRGDFAPEQQKAKEAEPCA